MAPLASVKRGFTFEAKATKLFPQGRSLAFDLHGKTIVNLRLKHGYAEAPTTFSDLQQLALDVHSALLPGGKADWNAWDTIGDGALCFEKPGVKGGKGQSTTAWDEALDFLSLQLWDPALMHGMAAHPKRCPCGCSEPLTSNGLCISTKRLKGLGGEDRDVLLLTRRWRCASVHHPAGQQKNFLDTDGAIRESLPLHWQEAYPFIYQSANAGLTNQAALQFDCFAAVNNGVSGLVTAVNDMRMRNVLLKYLQHSARQKAAEAERSVFKKRTVSLPDTNAVGFRSVSCS